MNSNYNYYSYVSKLKSYFLPEKVRNYWNNLLDYASFQLVYLHLKIIWNRLKKNVYMLHNCENNYLDVSNLIIEKLNVTVIILYLIVRTISF